MSRLVLSGFASLAVILSSNPYRAPDVATGRPARSDVVIENAVTVSSDPSLVDYPRAFINPTTGSVAVDDPYCKIERDRIAYPRTFLGDLPFPSVSGSPLPAAITRVVGLKDIWGCCLTNPGLNHECGGGDMHQAYVATLNRVMQLRGEQIGITNWVWITDAQIPLLDLDRPELTEPELAFIVGQARQRNLSVMLYLNIPSADLRGNALPRAPSREWYLNYLNSYAEFVERQAVLAERYGIATMMLNNFDYEINLWDYRDIVSAKLLAALERIRRVYRGRVILYDTFWFEDLSQLEELFRRVDGVLVTPWTTLLTSAEDRAPTFDFIRTKYSQMFAGWTTRLARFNKPLDIRVLIQSHRHFLSVGWVEDAFCTRGCEQNSLQTDFSIQATAYEALFEAIKEAHEGGLRVQSVATYGYWFTDTVLPRDSFPNIAHTVRNKPAEAVVYKWFNRSSTGGAPGAPSGLAGSTSGSAVRLSWAAPMSGGSPTTYVVEAGSESGLADLAAFSTNSTATTFHADQVPAGAYYIRVRAANSAGTSGPSNEVLLRAGGGGGEPPGAPSGLTARSSLGTVLLTWTAPTSGGAPTAYIIEAGSAPGLSDLATFSTGGPSPGYRADGVGSGTYYVRVRAKNTAGTSDPSNEVVLVVGTGEAVLSNAPVAPFTTPFGGA